jgi:FKBP-type peptidyl-prolyl cis-trans isomerase SlyD
MDSSILVAKDMVVSFHYVLKNKEGDVLDSSAGSEPLSYLHGYRQIVPGLEDALVGKTSGANFKVTVAPEQGYGEHVEEMVISVPKSEWDLPAEVGEGEVVELQSPEGEVVPALVVEIGDEFVVLDANHPLAGEELNFEIEIIGVRAATAEELSHGHAHGPDGHHHH